VTGLLNDDTEEGSKAPVLMSVNVGMPTNLSWQGKTVYTGVWKRPVDGPVMVRQMNIDGDGQGDLTGHGGEMRAVLVYQIQSYRHWQQHFGRDNFSYGEFAENLTVDGLPDDEVCIGDRYRIGEAEFEVTQPRVTCYRVGLRLGQPELPSLLVSHHRPGFYTRVIREGRIQAGDTIVKSKAGPGAVTVADADALEYLPHKDRAKLRLALQVPALSPGWQESFRQLQQEAEGAEAAAAPLPIARPGQYLTLRVGGAGDPPPVRSYSLSSAPGAQPYRISVKRAPNGAVSGYLTTRLAPGTDVEAAAPRGDFVLDAADDRPVLLVSAGIGVTPVMAMLHQLAAAHSQREVWWLHGARGPREHPLAQEAHILLRSLPQAREHIFYSAATPAERFGMQATTGHLDKRSLTALGIPADAAAYICGPNAFMTAITDALAALGVAPDRIHSELFGALDRLNPGITKADAPPPHEPPGPPGTGPLVTFARSRISTPFPDDRRNVLELAEACDVPTRWSCRTGVCHYCATPILSGDITYTPDPLDPPPDGQVLVCCARPRTEIVLDMKQPFTGICRRSGSMAVWIRPARRRPAAMTLPPLEAGSSSAAGCSISWRRHRGSPRCARPPGAARRCW
jgi:ferredoxin-NADP reductase/MOSC domain-containing protein YiiM